MLPSLSESAKPATCVVTHVENPENDGFDKAKRSPFQNVISNKWVHTVSSLYCNSEAFDVDCWQRLI